MDKIVLWLHAEWLKQRRDATLNPAEAFKTRREQMVEHLGGAAIPATFVAKRSLNESAPLLGCVSLTRMNVKRASFARAVWLTNLFVTPTARGQGVGRELVACAERYASELGESHIYLYTKTSKSFYRKQGWQEVLVPGKLQIRRKQGVAVMRKALKS